VLVALLIGLGFGLFWVGRDVYRHGATHPVELLKNKLGVQDKAKEAANEPKPQEPSPVHSASPAQPVQQVQPASPAQSAPIEPASGMKSQANPSPEVSTKAEAPAPPQAAPAPAAPAPSAKANQPDVASQVGDVAAKAAGGIGAARKLFGL